MLILYTIPSSDALAERDRRIEEYLAIMAGGDPSAMGGLYELIRTDVYAFALSKTAHREDAEDITQDTFIRIWQNAKAYTPMGKPMAWIFTIELNLIRRAATLAARTVSIEDHVLEDEGTDIAGDAIRSEFLREIMNTLTEQERQVVTLHAISGLKHRQIAALLDQPLPTVLSRYHRAMKKLQFIVKEGK